MSSLVATLPASCSPIHSSPAELVQARKRTSSFSYPSQPHSQAQSAFAPSPRPAKTARTTRMGAPLRRQETMIVSPASTTTSQQPESVKEPDPFSSTSASTSALLTTSVPYYRTLQYYKDQRLKRKAVLNRNGEPMTISTTPSGDATRRTSSHTNPFHPLSASKPTAKLTTTVKRSAPAPRAPSQVILPSVACPVVQNLTHRTSSPLAPSGPVTRPGRPVFPRSKPAPDLYKMAIRTRMAATPEGRKVLMMGVRLAYSIDAATKELERIVREGGEDGDIVMGDSTSTSTSTSTTTATSKSTSSSMPTSSPLSSSLAMPVLTASWVVVKGEDWEMIDCAA